MSDDEGLRQPKRQKISCNQRDALSEKSERRQQAEYEKAPRAGATWLEQLRADTAMPVQDSEGHLVTRKRTVADGANNTPVETTQSRKKNMKRTRNAKNEASEPHPPENSTAGALLKKLEAVTDFVTMKQKLEVIKNFSLMTKLPDLESRRKYASSLVNEIVADDQNSKLYLAEVLIFAESEFFDKLTKIPYEFDHKPSKELTQMADHFASQLLPIAVLLERLLPSYRVRDHSEKQAAEDEKETAPVMLSKEVKETRRFEGHVLSIYRRFLFGRMFICQTSPVFLEACPEAGLKLLSMCRYLFSTAVHTNFADEFLSHLLNFACALDFNIRKDPRFSAELLLPDVEEEVVKIKDAASGIITGDLTLNFILIYTEILCNLAAQLETGLEERRSKKKKIKAAANNKPKEIPSKEYRKVLAAVRVRPYHHLLRSILVFNILKFEEDATAELRRRGLSESEIASIVAKKEKSKAKNKSHDSVLERIGSTLVHGNFSRFLNMKAKFLNSIFVFGLTVLRTSHEYSPETVAVSLELIRRFGPFVNIELTVDVFNELKSVSVLTNKDDGSKLLSTVTAALSLSHQLSRASVPIDLQWIGGALVQCTEAALCNSSCIPHLLTAISKGLNTPGVFTAGVSALGKVPKLLALIQNLCALSNHLSSKNLYDQVKSLIQFIVKRYPSLEDAFLEDGAVASSLSTGVSVFWNVHLSEFCSVR